MLFQISDFHPFKLSSNSLLTMAAGFFSLALLSCNSQLPGLNPSDSLPVELRISEHPDSLFTLPDGLDFSVISKAGQGPVGTLIRWNLPGAPNKNYMAYTYDQQSRLVGSCDHTSFGYDELRLVHYQGAYIAQVYTGFDHRSGTDSPKTVDAIGWVSKYEYNAQNQLGQVLIYENVGGIFKLNHWIRYEYDVAGQLQLTRDTTGLAFSSVMSYQGIYPVEISYWENGDIYRQETYNPNQTPIKPTRRVFYNRVSNPRARLHLWPQNALTEHYPIGSGATSPDYENYQYRYGYDAQGRLSSVQERSVINYNAGSTLWTDWSTKQEFTYAP